MKRILLASVITLAALPAFAQGMMKDEGMSKDSMSKDSMSKDSMSKDSMSKDAMATGRDSVTRHLSQR
jgi:pentapeptide MXKDX repeat protein